MRNFILAIAIALHALPGRAKPADSSIHLPPERAEARGGEGQPTTESVVLDYAEQMPTFTGGEPALHQFLATHLTYPAEAFKHGQSGIVVVQFAVDEQGRTRDVTMVRTSDPQFDADAKRVVLVTPWWNPGREKGQPVRVRCTLPINFTFRRGS